MEKGLVVENLYKVGLTGRFRSVRLPVLAGEVSCLCFGSQMSIETTVTDLDDTERLGRDTVSAMRALARVSNPDVVSALYAALYELARRTEQTPRGVLDIFFAEAPSDEEWRTNMLPMWRALLDEGEEAA